jgi:hypothetical protein
VNVQWVDTPPVVEAGNNQFVYTKDEATTILTGAASDADLDPLTYRWVDGGTVDATTGQVQGGTGLATGSVGADGSAPLNLGALATPLPIGFYTLNLEVYDGTAYVTDSLVLTVDDSLLAVAPSGGGSYRMSDYNAKPVILAGQVADYAGAMVKYSWIDGPTLLKVGSVQTSPGGTPVGLPAFTTTSLSFGVHNITLKVNDGPNTVISAPVIVTIIDDVPPTLNYTVRQTILWPPNKAMIDPGIKVTASDNSGAPVNLTATVACNENGQAYGKEGVEWIWGNPKITPDGAISLKLCSDRLGKGIGRTYTVTITATDSSGNQSTANVKILVPHDQGKN